MRGKLLFVVGLATGYVLGTRAGRERYEQIKVGAQKVWSLPPVQQGVHALQDFAGARVDELQTKVKSSAKKAVVSVFNLDDSKPQKPAAQKPAAQTAAATTASTPTPAAPTSPATKPAARRPVTKPAASASSTEIDD